MAKRKRSTTNKKIEKWIREGRGQGEGVNYMPWLTIHDVPSEGVTPRHKGWKTNRIHHVMSKLELHYLYELEWADVVIDIREQYPLLPLERTMEIADSIGIKHPTDPSSQEPIVMTTDFMITVHGGKGNKEVMARQIKPSTKLKKREIEKFAIEQHFYKEQGIDWGIVTEKNRNEDFINNMEFLYNAKFLDNFPGLHKKHVQQISPILLDTIQKSNEALFAAALECDSILGVKEGACLFITKYMIANKLWMVDMNKTIDPMKKVER